MDVGDVSPGRGREDRSGPRAQRLGVIVIVLLAVCAAAAAWTSSAHAAALPDGRVFEQVTPPNTDNGAFNGSGSVAVVVNDDQALYGEGLDPLGAAQQSGYDPLFLAQRTPTGWTSTSLLPASFNPYERFQLLDATNDLSAMVFESQSSEGLSQPPDSQSVPYALSYRDPNGAFSTVVADADAQTDPTNPSVLDPSVYGGMSADGQIVVYSSEVAPAGLANVPTTREVYAWSPDGSVQRLGTPALAKCGLEVGGVYDYSILPGTTIAHTTNNVSSDGSTVFLQSGDAESPLPAACPSASQLYVDHAGGVTRISLPTDGTGIPSALARAIFQGATPDGTTAYFTTTMKLSANDPDTSSSDLYEWTAAQNGQPASVSCLSCSLPDHASDFVTSADVSQDGEYAYFAAAAASDGSTPLYVAHDGSVAEVAPSVVAGDNGSLDPIQGISGDGATVVYNATAPHDQVALYRSQFTGGAAGPRQCVSCQANGRAGDGALGLEYASGNLQYGSQSPRGASTIDGTVATGVSEGGNTIAFTSDDSLGAAPSSPQVYEWTPAGGAQPLAEGGGPNPLDASVTPDGSGIFLVSPQQLTSSTTQTDTLTLYDARLGGGFPGVTTSAPCSGDGCEGPPSTPPAAPGVVSTSGTSGNVHPTVTPRASVRLRRLSRGQLAAAARRGRITLRLAVHGSDELTIHATARLAGHTRTIASRRLHIHATGTKSRTRTVELSLSRAAKQQLARDGSLRVTIKVSMKHAGTRTTRFTLSEGRHR